MPLIDIWPPSFQCVCTCAALVELVVLQGPPELYVEHQNQSVLCSQLFMHLLISEVHGLEYVYIYNHLNIFCIRTLYLKLDI
jgi:hypothetical protein